MKGYEKALQMTNKELLDSINKAQPPHDDRKVIGHITAKEASILHQLGVIMGIYGEIAAEYKNKKEETVKILDKCFTALKEKYSSKEHPYIDCSSNSDIYECELKEITGNKSPEEFKLYEVKRVDEINCCENTFIIVARDKEEAFEIAKTNYPLLKRNKVDITEIKLDKSKVISVKIKA